MKHRWVGVATLILVTLLASAPVWGPGLVNTRAGGDSPFLLQRAHQMLVNLRAGVFPVRWMPDAAYGLGYPFFSYYAGLPYYLAGLLGLAGLDLLTALKLVQTLGFVAAALAMYGWMRSTARSQWAAWLAAVAYAFAPFHLVNVYVRGDSLSEFYAFVFYPLILWALDKVQSPRSESANHDCRWLTSLVWPALAYAGLTLTHNLSALIFSPFALLYLLALILRARARWRHILSLGLLSLGFGLLLSAWVWLPVLAEMDVVQTGTLTQGYFHYASHFRAADLVQYRILFDYTIQPGGSTPFAMGLPQATFAIVGVLVLIVRGLRRGVPERAQGRLDAPWGFVLLGLLVSTALVTPLSRLLWDHVPLLPLVQFPWRFLSVQALFTAAATAALVPGPTASWLLPLVSRQSPSGIRNLRAVCFALPIAAILVASVLLPLQPDRLPIGPADVTVERLQLYELFTSNIGTTIRHEYLYQAVVPRPFISDALIEPGTPPGAIPLDGASLGAVLEHQSPVRQVWRVWGEGGGLAFPLLYWPGWGASVDGEPADAWPVEGSGYLALGVPPGEHAVVLQLGRTPVRAAAETVSLAAGLAVLAIVARGQIRKPRSQSPSPKSAIASWLLVVGVVGVGYLLLRPGGELDAEADLTMDFIQMPYLHHNPDGVDFDGVVRLAGYALSADELAPGDTLTVALDWSRVSGEFTVTVRLVSPAAVRFPVQPLAEATVPVSSASSPRSLASLRLPDDTPRGVYLLELHLFGPEGEIDALTAGGAARGTLYLRPVRVPRGPPLPADVPVLGPFGPDIRLYTAAIVQLDPRRLAVKLAWSAQRPVAANYRLSLRLLNANEQVVAAVDTQPGHGFLPTSLWRPGELVTDETILTLPEDLSRGDDHHLLVILYRMPTRDEVGRARLGDFALPLETSFVMQRPRRCFSLPYLEHPLGVDFGGEVRLAGFDVEQEGETLELTLWWQALQTPQADYTVFVHLFDPETETLIVQSDAMPQGGAYPTSWWAAGEVISETVTLPLDEVPQGTYHLALGLYDRTVTRLLAIGPEGQRVLDDRLVLPVDVEWGR